MFKQELETIDEAMASYPLTPPSSFQFPELPPTPSAAAPSNITILLQDVLGVMTTLMSEEMVVRGEDEDGLLGELTDIVVTLQEEAEELVGMADLVEELVEGEDSLFRKLHGVVE